ncbi:hypothetical protein [Staphylococcus phage vB_StaM_PB50]|nr:hypothetical protein [Staphylococcus phage vB_StaM_PB50]
MNLTKKSFIVTFHATLVAKGVLELEEVSEGNELKSLVEEVLNEVGFGEVTESSESYDPYDSSGPVKMYGPGSNGVWVTSSTEQPLEKPNYEYSDAEPVPSKPENTPVEAEIDPIDEEHRVEGFNEDSEVQGIGRATEVEPQEDSENADSARGGILPQ